jgi:hypothetical protein
MILQRSFSSLGLLALVTLPLTAAWGQASPSPAAAGLAEHPALEPASCIAPPSPSFKPQAHRSHQFPAQTVAGCSLA